MIQEDSLWSSVETVKQILVLPRPPLPLIVLLEVQRTGECPPTEQWLLIADNVFQTASCAFSYRHLAPLATRDGIQSIDRQRARRHHELYSR